MSHGHHPPVVLLRDMHDTVVVDYDIKDRTPPQSQVGVGARWTQLAGRGFTAATGWAL